MGKKLKKSKWEAQAERLTKKVHKRAVSCMTKHKDPKTVERCIQRVQHGFMKDSVKILSFD